ncbi:hypothetical protein OFC87_33465, partial [Escherichia coli]|nr:hypothetical protein [Escherichia coli]
HDLPYLELAFWIRQRFWQDQVAKDKYRQQVKQHKDKYRLPAKVVRNPSAKKRRDNRHDRSSDRDIRQSFR